jgi:hypothetical protein
VGTGAAAAASGSAAAVALENHLFLLLLSCLKSCTQAGTVPLDVMSSVVHPSVTAACVLGAVNAVCTVLIDPADAGACGASSSQGCSSSSSSNGPAAAAATGQQEHMLMQLMLLVSRTRCRPSSPLCCLTATVTPQSGWCC